MKLHSWQELFAAACSLALCVTAVAEGTPEDQARGTPSESAVAATKSEIDSRHRAELSQQAKISKAIHAGTASPADIAAAATAIQENQASRAALEKQLHDQLAQQRNAAATADPSSAAKPATGGASSEARPAQVSGSKPASSEPQTRAAARQDLIQKLAALKKDAPNDAQALADVITQWELANASTFAKAEEARATAADAHHSQAPHDLKGLKSIPEPKPDEADNAPPKMKALLRERAAAARELQVTLLQTANLSPEERQAALSQWQANHAAHLDQLTAEAAAETKALGLTGVAKAERAQREAAGDKASAP